MQQLTEFDCFMKSFTYLAARLPRTEFLEPFLDDAIVGPVEKMKKRIALMTKMKDLQLSEVLGVDENAFMAGMQLAIGKPPEAALQAGDVPLSEAEPDMYPCLLAMCGSGFGFFKVSIYLSVFIVVDVFSVAINNAEQMHTHTRYHFNSHFWTRKAGPKKSTLVVLVVVISSLKIPKAFLIRSGAQRNFAYTFGRMLTFPTDLPSQI